MRQQREMKQDIHINNGMKQQMITQQQLVNQIFFLNQRICQITDEDETKNEIISINDDEDQIADKIVQGVQESLKEVSDGEQRLIQAYRRSGKQEKERMVNFAEMIVKKENIELDKISKNTKYGSIRFKRYDERNYK
ncbi:Hypothetical_protein [Hexamita inflata]|uniref:Hypothetical_protein n=1 Tax=Hexamita inflata TaxID=28002 RepID=A0AA86PUA0_9EUKA|nr:Hypothetical protein HINF_LOCUS28689 [Hexamita inflata]